MRLLNAFLILMLLNAPAFGEDLSSTRERALFEELRCVVCQNQTIASSDAGVAKDLRQIVREQIAAGRTNAEIKAFLVDRYGEFVLMRPALAPHTLALWALPVLLLAGGCAALWRLSRRTPMPVNNTLDADEERDLKRILKRSHGSRHGT